MHHNYFGQTSGEIPSVTMLIIQQAIDESCVKGTPCISPIAMATQWNILY